ncbi:MAG: hypothetical protein RLZZ57_2824 [Pseudomonadota bacterium]|jgi:hypothetical protein
MIVEESFCVRMPSLIEALNQHRDLLHRLGAAGDTYWSPQLADSVAERNRRAIWGER